MTQRLGNSPMTSIQQRNRTLQRAAPPALPQSVELARLGDALHELRPSAGVACRRNQGNGQTFPTPENRRRKLDPMQSPRSASCCLPAPAFEKSCTRAGIGSTLSAACSSCQTPKPTKIDLSQFCRPLDHERLPAYMEPAYISRRGRTKTTRANRAPI